MQQTVAIGRETVPVLGSSVPKTDTNRPTKTVAAKDQPTVSKVATPSTRLVARAEAVGQMCRRAGLGDIRPVVVGPLIEEGVYYPHRDGWSMIVVPSGLDPTRTAIGRFPVPVEVQKRLRAAVEVGIEFDRIYIAHELPGHPLGSSPRQVSMEEAAARIPRPPATATALRIHRALDLIGVLGRRATRMAEVAGAALLTATAGAMPFDPVILGVLVDNESEVGVWFGVDSWSW